MTAVPEWDVADARNTDAELVSGSIAGDKAAFAQIYDRYADRLHDFCVGMLRDRDAAADCTQDTFCIAATRLGQLRDPDRLRPWLYSIARNEALRRLRELRRETPSEELPDVVSDDAGPDTLAARNELADLIAEAAGGLSDRDRAVFDLAYRHGLSGVELGDALGVSQANAHTLVKRLKTTIERSLGALLVARRAKSNASDCLELDEMLADWDGQFSVLMRKRIARHIESCDTCDDERRRLVSPAALLGSAPVFVPAPAWLREKTLDEARLPAEHTESAASGGGGRSRKWMLAAAMLLGALVSAGLLLVWLDRDKGEPATVTPTDVTAVEPKPTSQTPRSANPPPRPPVVEQPSLTVSSTPRSANPPPTGAQNPPTFEPPVQAPTPADRPEASENPAPSSVRPPMSFSPTVLAPRPLPPEPGGGSGGEGGGGGGGPTPQ